MKFKGIYAGVFATAMGFMFLEVFASGVLGFVLGPHAVYLTIAMAMLGMGAAGTAMMLTRTNLDLRDVSRRASTLSVLAALGTLVFLIAAAYLKMRINTRLDEVSGEVAFKLWAQTLNIGDIAFVGLPLAIPYFFHGCVLAYVFRNAGDMPVAKLYGADLLGACAGALTCVGVGSYFRDYTSSQVAVFFIPLLAGVAFFTACRPSRATKIKGIGFAVAVVAIFATVNGVGTLEPKLHLASAARLNWQFTGNYEAEELDHWWTFNGRLAALRLRHPNDPKPYYVMVHGEGEGHARVLNANDDQLASAREGMKVAKPTVTELVRRRLLVATSASIAGCSANNVLILLAGAGAEMILVDQLTAGKANITGVEMAPEMFGWVSSQEDLGVRKFLSDPKHHMVLAEAREFLARDRSLYDCITVSFPGAAGRSFHNGSAANLPDHVFTREGFDELLRHLAPNGQFAIYFGSIVRHALTAWEAMGPSAARDRAFIIIERQASPNQDVFTNHGPHLMFVKPSGYTREDVARFRSMIEPFEGKITYDPFSPPDDSNPYSLVLRSKDPVQTGLALQDKVGVNLTPPTDDKPFPFDLVPASAYLSANFWKGTPPKGLAQDVAAMWEARRVQMTFLFYLCLAGLAVILAPVLVFRRRLKAQLPRSADVAYFAAIGGGFMLIEMGLIHKLRLLVGTPGLTIALVLGSLVLFTGLGSLASNSMFGTGRLTLRRAALGVALCAMAFLLLTEFGFEHVVGAPRFVKLLIAFLSPAVPAFFMGQMYPQGLSMLRIAAPAHVPFCMGVNALAGTIATGIGIVLVPVVGFRALLLAGAALYVIVMALPIARPGRSSHALGMAGVSPPSSQDATSV